MVSRRNFASITTVMLIILFLFQFLNVAKESLSDYSTNIYVQDMENLSKADSVVDSIDNDFLGNDIFLDDIRQETVYIGSESEGSMGDMISNWGRYVKRKVSIYNSLSEYETAINDNKQVTPQFILIDPDFIDWEQSVQIAKLQKLTDQGINLIFGKIPDVSFIKKSARLRKLLGINDIIQESITAEGIHLYDGLLIGGEVIYKVENEEDEKRQDLNLDVAWYELTNGTKVYMKAMLADEQVDVQKYPPVIWRKSQDDAFVFVVNGEYMSDMAGMGLLTGMMCEMQNCTIYPVINAQNFVIADYPGFANENAEKLQQMYSQNMRGIFRDIIWPAFVTMNSSIKLGMTSMLSIQLDYEDEVYPSNQDISYYMQELKALDAEVGWSADQVSDVDAADKVEQDEAFWDKELSNYRFSSMYQGSMTDKELLEALSTPFLSDVCTVVGNVEATGESDVVGYVNDKVTRQESLIDGYEHTYSQDLYIRSVETTLGYTSVLADIGRVVYPDSEQDGWEKLSKELMANTETYWKPFAGFDKTTASECDKRIRRFLSVSYQYQKKEDKVILKTSPGEETAWFVLRTSGEKIVDISTGSYKKLEENVWLIGVDSESTIITLEPVNTMLYYE